MIQLRETALTNEVYQVAAQEGKAADDVVAEAVRQYLAQYRQRRIHSETHAWYRLPAEVRNQFKGRYVAVYNHEIIDNDPDRMALYTRMRQRFGRQPVLLIEGGDQPMPVYSVRSAFHP